MKVSFWGVALVMSLTMLGSAVYADETNPNQASGGVLVPANPESIQRLRAEKKQKLDAQKAKAEAEAREKEKKDKMAKIERRTGRPCKSWQVKNR